MFIPSDDKVGLGEDPAFQDSIVRFISEIMEVRFGFQDSGCFADRANQHCDPRIRPSELGLEYIGSFSENGNRGEELEVTVDGLHVRLFRVAAGDDKCRDEDIRAENRVHA